MLMIPQIPPSVLMENKTKNVISAHLQPIVAPSMALLNAVPDVLLPVAPQYQGSPPALDFLQPSTSDDFKYEPLSQLIQRIS